MERAQRHSGRAAVSSRHVNTASVMDSPPVSFRTERQPNVFSRLTNSQRKKVIARGAYCRISQNETLFAQGDRHRGVFLIETGLIRTFYSSPSGREITLSYWQPGNIVGTPQVCDTSNYMWSGVAAVETSVLSFRGEQLRELMEKIPPLAIGIVEALEYKGKCLSALVQMLGTRSVAERLGMLLYNLSELYGVPEAGGIVIGEPFTHEVLAQMVGASRQWVTMTLDRFQRDGLIRIGKCRTIIPKPRLLLARSKHSEPR